MNKFDWNEFIKATARQVSDNVGSNGRLKGIKTSLELQLLWKSINQHTIVLGFGLAFLVLQFEDTWVTNTPLFGAIGVLVCLVSLIICWLAGCVFWVFTGSKLVCVWAKQLMPYAIEPYRSAAGFIGFFLIVTVIWKNPYVSGKLSYLHVCWIKRSLQVMTCAAWSTAIGIFIIKWIW